MYSNNFCYINKSIFPKKKQIIFCWVGTMNTVYSLFIRNLSRWCYRERSFWPGVRDGDDEDDWPAQEHHQSVGSVHTGGKWKSHSFQIPSSFKLFQTCMFFPLNTKYILKEVGVTKKLLAAINFHCNIPPPPYCGSQWLPETICLPTFFKIY